jgi:hypothetical protein
MRYADRFRAQHLAWDSFLDAEAMLRFDEAATDYRTAYKSLSQFKATSPNEPNSSLYPWPSWEQKLAEQFHSRVPTNFLEQPIIKLNMVFHGRLCNAGRLARVRRVFGEAALRDFLAEDPVGTPRICDVSLRTSSNRLYHAFHLAMYQQTLGKPFARGGMIVEWGGGYGDMARLLWRLSARAESTTLVLIDLPAVSALQWVYLTSILGRQYVHIVETPDRQIHEGCVNIMNSSVAFDHPAMKADCFLSTWALTESPHELQAEVARRKFFGARNVLLAFSMDGDNRIAEPLLKAGGATIPVPYMTLDGYAPSKYGFL